MKRAIVVGTSKYTKDFLKDCLESIKETPYDILIVSNDGYEPDLSYFDRQHNVIINSFNGWELGVIERAKERLDTFIFIMDSTLIKNIKLFEESFAIEGNVVYTKGNFHYMGKFVTKELPNSPIVKNKEDAVFLESRWLDGFKYAEFIPDLPVHTNVYEYIHGKKRMRLENKYMIKWKGTYFASAEHPIPAGEIMYENKGIEIE